MIKSSKYIIKKVIIGILIGLGIMFFKDSILTAKALSYNIDSLLIDNWELTVGNWYERGQDVGFKFTFIGTADTDQETNLYGQIILCAGPSNNAIAWAQSSDAQSWDKTIKNVVVNNTNVYCKVGTTSGKVQQLFFTTRAVDGDITANVRMSYKDGYTGFTIVSYGFKDSPWEYIQSENDYTSQLNAMTTTISNNWQTQINKLQDIWNVDQATLAEAQTQTGWQKRMAEASEAFNKAVNSDDIDTNDQDSKINTIKNSGYNNASISDIILLPVKVFQTAVNGLSSDRCTPINLGTLYDTELILPCISSNDMQGWLSTTLYGLVDALMSFGVILGIRRLVIKIYRTIVYLRDGGGTID